jgi:protein tyrosine/serine phosphatase
MLATVIGHLADPGGLPAVFHCTAGKDRTGMVAALVLSLVGVPDDAIVHDYTLTDDRMVLVLERLRGANLVPGDAPLVLEKVARAEAESMETFLHAVRDEFGDAEGWARSVGLGDEQLHSLREVLVGHAR